MRASFRAVIFDLDDTLFDCTGSLIDASRHRAAQALVDAGLPMSVDEAFELQKDLAADHGPHFLVFDEIGERYDLDQEALQIAYRAYNREEVADDIHLFPDVLSTLRTLRRQGIKCFLLTVGNHRRQRGKITKLGLEGKFDDILVSDVDRGARMTECLRYFLSKYKLNPAEILIVGDRPSEEIRYGNELGFTTAQMLHGRFSRAEPRDQFEVPDYKITNIFQVPTILRMVDLGKPPDHLRIVAMGGGTGLPIVLEGCKTYSKHLTAIVAVTDSGRSSGKLRDELGILAPGDVRNCLVALSEPGERERRLNELFQYRFAEGSLEGMSLGNLVIAATTDMTGRFEKGIRLVSNLLNINGKVLPSTLTDCHVCAELKDGSVVEQEVQVRGIDKPPIEKVFLKPQDAEALDEAVEEIENADIIVLGPGSLFTSVIPNILVPRIRDAVKNTRARVYYVCNAMTQPGQTDGFSARDHYIALEKHLGPQIIDCMILNSTDPPQNIVEKYRADGAELVGKQEDVKDIDVRTVFTDLLEDISQPRVLWEKQDLLRHHPDKLGDAVCRLFGGMEARDAVPD
ncbi:MAG: YvcK family protein [Candidatus Brocadiia bacterium]